MDSYVQILCRFQKSKEKVPPPSLPCTKKSTFNPPLPQDEKKITFWRVKGDFLVHNPSIWSPLQHRLIDQSQADFWLQV